MSKVNSSMDISTLADKFRQFSKMECSGVSLLYEMLSANVADDHDLLMLASHAKPAQPVANMLFAAVQDLLFERVSGYQNLALYYPNLTDKPDSYKEAFSAFRAFCLDHSDAIKQRLQTRLVQTNEVGRCVCLWPAIAQIGAKVEGPLALVEVGASAGLNLLGDHFAYQFNPGGEWGVASQVKLQTTLRGTLFPPLATKLPAILHRIGIDLNPIDVTNEADVRWLQALIWPDHLERQRRLKAAVEVAKLNPPELLAGDVVEQLPKAIDRVPSDLPVAVFHSFSMNQWSDEIRKNVADILQSLGQKGKIYRLSLEAIGSKQPILERTFWVKGQAKTDLLATCEPHGQWVQWEYSSAS